MAKAKPARKPPLLAIGIVLYLVAWLVPVFQGQQLFGSMGGLGKSLGGHAESAIAPLSGPEWLPGWAACHFSWSLLTEQKGQGGNDWKRIVVGSTCLTNVIMLFALVARACGARPRVLGVLLLACAALDASWLYLGGADLISTLRAGYYLWTASFVLAGIGMLLPGGSRSRQ